MILFFALSLHCQKIRNSSDRRKKNIIMVLDNFKYFEENCTCRVTFRLNALPFYEEFYMLYRSTSNVLYLRKDIPTCNGSFERLWKRTNIPNLSLTSDNYIQIARKAFNFNAPFKPQT